jgi:hypothetical protein
LAKAHGLVPHVRNEMNMVGHNDEAASEPTVTPRAVEKEGNEPVKGGFVVEDICAAIDAYC